MVKVGMSVKIILGNRFRIGFSQIGTAWAHSEAFALPAEHPTTRLALVDEAHRVFQADGREAEIPVRLVVR